MIEVSYSTTELGCPDSPVRRQMVATYDMAAAIAVVMEFEEIYDYSGKKIAIFSMKRVQPPSILQVNKEYVVQEKINGKR